MFLDASVFLVEVLDGFAKLCGGSYKVGPTLEGTETASLPSGSGCCVTTSPTIFVNFFPGIGLLVDQLSTLSDLNPIELHDSSIALANQPPLQCSIAKNLGYSLSQLGHTMRTDLASRITNDLWQRGRIGSYNRRPHRHSFQWRKAKTFIKTRVNKKPRTSVKTAKLGIRNKPLEKDVIAKFQTVQFYFRKQRTLTTNQDELSS